MPRFGTKMATVLQRTASFLGMRRLLMAFFEEFDVPNANNGGCSCLPTTEILSKSNHVAENIAAAASSRMSEMAYCPRCGEVDGEDDHHTPYICDECWFTEDVA